MKGSAADDHKIRTPRAAANKACFHVLVGQKEPCDPAHYLRPKTEGLHSRYLCKVAGVMIL